jgi:threonine dehydrogenase-like Zn-dependent dehydrogenase
LPEDMDDVELEQLLYPSTIKLIETGNIVVDDMITHRIPLKDIAKGFQLVLEGLESIKVIIKPNN